MVDPVTGLVVPAEQCPSPNQDARPIGAALELIVVHGISLPPGEFGGGHVEALFSNTLDPELHPYFVQIAGLRVSAHVLIHRDGRVTQFVPMHRRAWHAGQSSFAGRTACNDFSIGIEMEGTDELAYTAAQYSALIDLIQALRAAYPNLAAAPVVGHSDIAPGRKTDPGPAFDWNLVRDRLAGAVEVS
ncbi:MAG: 1,6-anhydro-N-acetylmuramyl-L-alanine amidase AmpD [Pseudomonadota bacterium]